jgi:hypothetical protein
LGAWFGFNFQLNFATKLIIRLIESHTYIPTDFYLNKQRDIQTYVQTNIRTDKHTNRQPNVQTNIRTDKHTYRQTYGQTNIRKDKHTFRQIYEKTNIRKYEKNDLIAFNFQPKYFYIQNSFELRFYILSHFITKTSNNQNNLITFVSTIVKMLTLCTSFRLNPPSRQRGIKIKINYIVCSFRYILNSFCKPRERKT